MKLILSSVFESDLAELSAYFNEASGADLSIRFENEIVRLVQLLREHPEAGRQHKDLKPSGVRSMNVRHFRNYLLFYQIKAGGLVLLRVRFGGMDLAALFS